jgi:hypothetical protein
MVEGKIPIVSYLEWNHQCKWGVTLTVPTFPVRLPVALKTTQMY